MLNLPHYQLQRRSDHGWQTIATFDSWEEALKSVQPWSRVIPDRIPPRRKFAFGIGLAFAFAVGFFLAAVMVHRAGM